MTTRFMTDEEEQAAEDHIAVNIAAGAERIEQAGCGQHGHAWAPNHHGRLRCVHCSVAPHAPIPEEIR